MGFPKVVRDAFFELDMGFNHTGKFVLDCSVMNSAHLSLEAKGFYAWARSRDDSNEYSLDTSIADGIENEPFEEIMDELIDEGIALRFLYAIDEPASYRVFDSKMECFLDFLTSVAQDYDVDGCSVFTDYLESLEDDQRKKLMAKVLP